MYIVPSEVLESSRHSLSNIAHSNVFYVYVGRFDIWLYALIRNEYKELHSYAANMSE